MGLDLYAGSLSRYYAGDWKTIIQSQAPTGGLPVEVVQLGGIEISGASLPPDILEALSHSPQARSAQPPRRSWWQKLKEGFETAPGCHRRRVPTNSSQSVGWLVLPKPTFFFVGIAGEEQETGGEGLGISAFFGKGAVELFGQLGDPQRATGAVEGLDQDLAEKAGSGVEVLFGAVPEQRSSRST